MSKVGTIMEYINTLENSFCEIIPRTTYELQKYLKLSDEAFDFIFLNGCHYPALQGITREAVINRLHYVIGPESRFINPFIEE